ncbi:MAG: PAS domain S-box protein [Acidobacteriaceae bacterium]
MLDARPALNSREMELIDCIELPVLVIDRDLTVAAFNTAAAKLLFLSGSDYGRHLHSIRKPAGTQQLEELCEHVIATGFSHRVEVADGEGSRFSVNVGCRKADQNTHGAVLTFTNVTAFRESLERAIEEREFTKVVLNTVADSLVIVDSDLRIQAVNQAFYALFQTSRQDSQGAHLYRLGSGDWDIPRLRALLDVSASPNEDHPSLECDHEFPGVGRRTLWLNARPLIQGTHTGQTTLITIQDITERKRAMEALRESEERLRLAQQVGTIGSFEWNAQTNANRWSPELEAIYGLRPGEFSGTQEAWVQLLHPEDRAAAIRQVEKAFRTDAPVQAEFRVIWPDGSARWILGRWQVFRDLSGQPIRMTGVNIDITSRKEAEQGQRRLAAIVESSDDAIVGKNLSGIVTSWNPAAERMFGHSAKEIIGRPITTIIPQELHDDERKILETIGRGERVERRETVRVTRKGERMDVSLTVSPVRDEEGRVIGAASITRDITQEKKTEQTLRVTERLASVGRMAATVAHEINNPLEAVINLVYLARGCAVREDMQKYLNTIDEELDRVSHLTRQTLGFYREAKAPSAVRVGPMVDSLVSFFGTRARNKGIEILPEIRRDPEIYAVAGEIRQVITNLLSNSIDAVGSGGLIRIRIDAATCLHGNQSPGVRITVADSGPGIPLSIRSKLFEPFFTTKADVGTGLGLWVCTNIVKRHHGSIRVKSSTIPGKSWTAFCVVLPPRQGSESNPLKQEV